MQPRVYSCPRFPSLGISRGLGLPSITFDKGIFVAYTEDECAVIESNEWFGNFIKLSSVEPDALTLEDGLVTAESAAAPAPAPESPAPKDTTTRASLLARLRRRKK